MQRSRRRSSVLFLTSILFSIIGCYWIINAHRISVTVSASLTTRVSAVGSIASRVNLVDLHETREEDTTCIKTKELFNLYSTTICIHSDSDIVSSSVARDGIWEEEYVTSLLRILIKNPFLDVVDIGANIGTYTMFTAGALGRLTLAVDCFLPNIERIARAVQIQHVQSRVILVHNALYSKSGEYLTLSNSVPSMIQLGETSQQNNTDLYVVKTIRLDDLIPIVVERKIQSAVIKIDIEGSEFYMCETGSILFDLIDVQLVMMEWGHGFRKRYSERYHSIVDFFTQRNYVPTDTQCVALTLKQWGTQLWPGNIFWVKKVNFKKNIC